MTRDLPNLLFARSIQLTGVMSPGPGVAFILGIATARGRAPAFQAGAEWRGAMIATLRT
ncbi:hypothetical protein AB1M95_16820 [Sulfitobacter sp. LCG007]